MEFALTEKISSLKYSEFTQKIIGCAFEVHRTLGMGFTEFIYQQALAYEFQKAQLEFLKEVELDIFYKDLQEPIGKRRADFVVENRILVEIKALSLLENTHTTQVLNYLRAFRLEVGLLINFGEKSLTFKRLVLSSNSSRHFNQ
mgnify:CR=1 FL=1